MEKNNVGMIILICLKKSVEVVKEKLWRIIYMIWKVSGMMIDLFEGIEERN